METKVTSIEDKRKEANKKQERLRQAIKLGLLLSLYKHERLYMDYSDPGILSLEIIDDLISDAQDELGADSSSFALIRWVDQVLVGFVD